MAMIVDSLPDAVHSVDASGRITAINAAARRMYGYADPEIVGLHQRDPATGRTAR